MFYLSDVTNQYYEAILKYYFAVKILVEKY